MSRNCQTCGEPTEEVFHIPWLAKFYRCESGHCEARGPEGTRQPAHETYFERLKDCRLYAEEFVKNKARRQRGVGEGAAPSGA
jgi:hypothetical protein